jgi:hypothetical protein
VQSRTQSMPVRRLGVQNDNKLLVQAVDNLSTSWEQAMRIPPVDKLYWNSIATNCCMFVICAFLLFTEIIDIIYYFCDFYVRIAGINRECYMNFILLMDQSIDYLLDVYPNRDKSLINYIKRIIPVKGRTTFQKEYKFLSLKECEKFYVNIKQNSRSRLDTSSVILPFLTRY